MRIAPPSPLNTSFPRSNDEWLVGRDEDHVLLRASAEAGSSQPPAKGWNYRHYSNSEWTVDNTISCHIFDVSSPPCCLTISLSGAAKEAEGICEGEYKSTGLFSLGRPVIVNW